jgi:secreted PhoX family phosphatase
MALKRQNCLLFLEASVGNVALGSFPKGKKSSMPYTNPTSAASCSGSGLSFKPIREPIPLPTDGIEVTKQLQDYSEYEVKDELALPENFTSDIVAAWGDNVGDSRFGYNNDYLCLY